MSGAPGLPDGWVMPPPGSLVRQTVPAGPFVAQTREDLGAGSCRLTRHPDPMGTVFAIVGYEERAEIGMACHVVLLRDQRDDREYVVECGIMGPGLPVDAFAAVDRAASLRSASRRRRPGRSGP